MKRKAMELTVLFIIIALVWLVVKHNRNKKIYYEPYTPAPITEVHVSHVYDGDSIQVIDSTGDRVDVRLYGIDTPELSQPYGVNALKYLKKLVLKKTVTMDFYGFDKYGRALGLIFLGDVCVNQTLVKAGLAESYMSNMFDNEHLEAQRDMKGMWTQGAKYISPQNWRDYHR